MAAVLNSTVGHVVTSALSEPKVRVGPNEEFWESSSIKEVPMNKKYIVRLSAKERRTLRETIRKLKGSSQKVRRAQMLLKADVAGPAWTDEQIAVAFESRTRTIEKLRERFVSEGFEQTLHGKSREQPATEKILGGKQEAQLIAMRLGPPPKGYANWTLRLLARKLVELEIVPAISHETVRATLKKTG
jgi:hypothetical protein